MDERYGAVVGQAAGLLGTVRLAATLVQERRAVDLAGLDDWVGRLCAQTLDLPPEQAKQLRPQLVCIAAAMDRLQAAMGPQDGAGKKNCDKGPAYN